MLGWLQGSVGRCFCRLLHWHWYVPRGGMIWRGAAAGAPGCMRGHAWHVLTFHVRTLLGPGRGTIIRDTAQGA